MKMRLLPILGITGLFSIALTGSAAAGGGGWPPAPGTYRATDTSANASLVGPSTIVCYPLRVVSRNPAPSQTSVSATCTRSSPAVAPR